MERANADAGAATAAGALYGVALLLVCSMLYERFVAPATTGRLGGGGGGGGGGGSVETWWWGVYVLGAPLVFGGGWGGAVAPVIGLFGTRFAIEVLAAARGHWLLALGAGSRCPRHSAREPAAELTGVPVLVDAGAEGGDEMLDT